MSASAIKLSSGRWRCKAYFTDETGKYTSKSFTADSKKEAEYLAKLFLIEREHRSIPTNRTLGELADQYIESRENILSPSTIVGYKKIRRTAMQDIIDCRIGYLSKHLYQKSVSTYSKNRSYKTVLSAHVFYHTVLRENNIPIADDILLPQKEKKEITVPSIEEIQQFLKSIRETRIYLYCLFAVVLGLRKSEIIAIQWKDIDIYKKTVSINKARVKNENKEYVLKSTKTYDGARTLHLPEVLKIALGQPGDPDDFVIQESPDALQSLYNRLCKKTGFEYNFHSLRHCYASIMLQSGIPNRYAREKMGHATENMLQKVYQHTFKSKQEEYDLILDTFFTAKLSSAE